MLEWIAILSMLIDHIGITFFPDNPYWRIIGRIAFPLYTFFIVLGLERTRSKRRYIKRLFILAVVSQLPYFFLFKELRLNVIFTFLLLAILFSVLEKNKLSGQLILQAATVTIFFIFDSYLDYGLYGFLLFNIYYYGRDTTFTLLFLHIVLNIVDVYLFHGLWLQMFSLVGSIFIIAKNKLPMVSFHRVLYRSFYPAHLLILYILTVLIGV